MARFRSAMLASAVASAALAVASAALAAEHAYADGGSFRFPPFSNPSPPASPASYSARPGPPPKEEPRVRNDNPRTSAAGFDPEALERGAKALREISSSSQAKKMFEVLKKQEETRQEELAAKKSEFQALQAQHETDRQRVIYEEQKKLVQQQAQTKAQMARYEDELTRKRMQAEHESQRARNQELVKLQEESSIRQEQIRRTTEEQIQAQRRQTEREKAEIERETIRVKALAEAEGRAHEAKLAEEVNRRMLIEWANAEREKWISAINTTFDHIGGGLRAILSDQNKLIVAVGGVTALAAGVYTTREGAKVVWGYVNRVVSAIHAVVAVSFASFSLQDWSCSLFAFASRSSPLQMKALAVTLSYLIYDLVCCLFDRNPKMDNSIHHLVSIVGIGAGLAYEMCGSEMVASIWITEISRPFLHMRELLKELGYRDTNLNFTVDVLFAAIFSLARMVGGPYLTYVTLRADNPLLIKAMALGLELVLRVLQDPQDVQI